MITIFSIALVAVLAASSVVIAYLARRAAELKEKLRISEIKLDRAEKEAARYWKETLQLASDLDASGKLHGQAVRERNIAEKKLKSATRRQAAIEAELVQARKSEADMNKMLTLALNETNPLNRQKALRVL